MRSTLIFGLITLMMMKIFPPTLDNHQGYLLWASQSAHKVSKDGVLVKVLLNGNALDLKCFYFKMTMVTNNEQIMRKRSLVNLVMKLWTKISSFFILKHKLSKFMMFVEIACV